MARESRALIRTAALIAAGTLVAAAGCNRNSTTTSSRADTRPATSSASATPAASTTTSTSRPAARSSVRRDAVPAGMTAVSMAYPTGEEATSAIRLEHLMPETVRANGEFEAMIRVTNLTNTTLQNVVVNSSGMENFNLLGSSPSMVPTANGGQWAIGEIAPRSTETIRLDGRAGAAGSIGNCLGVSYNNTLCASAPVVEPQLQLAKMAPSRVTACDNIELQYEVMNPGSGVAENVRISDTLPNGWTTTDGQRTVSIAVGDLAPGQRKKYGVSIANGSTGTFRSPARAAATGDLNANASETTTVVVKPELMISTDCPEKRFLGRNITSTVTVGNTGDAAADNTIVRANISNGAQVVRASDGGTISGSTVTWNLGSMSADAKRELTVTSKPSGLGTYRLTANIDGECADPKQDMCETRIEGIPAILLEVVDVSDPIEVGGTVQYVITVTNQGSANDSNIRIRCELPQQMSFVSGAGTTAASARGRTVTLAPVATLAPKAKAQWTLTIKAEASGDTRFGVSMTSDQLTSPVEETEATNLYE